MKKYFKKELISVFLTASFLLLTCQGYAQQKLRISAEAWIGEKFQLKTLADRFMKDHPEVMVEIQKTLPEQSQIYMLQWMRGKTDVDCALGMHPASAAAYHTRGLIQDLSYALTGEFRKEEWVKAFLDTAAVAGKYYCLPFMGASYGMVVRRDLLEQAGLADSKGKVIPVENWKDVYEYAQKLTVRKGEKTVRYGLEIQGNIRPYAMFTFLAVLKAATGSFYKESDPNKGIDFTNEEIINFLKLWEEMYKEGVCSIDSFTNHNAPREGFKAGTIAMIVTSVDRWPECGQVVGMDKTTLMPLPKALENGSFTSTIGMVIPEASAVPELAMSWFKEQLLSNYSQQWTAKLYGKIPVMAHSLKGLEEPEWELIMRQAEISTPEPIYADWVPLQDMLAVEMQTCIMGEQSPEEAVERIKEKSEKMSLKNLQLF